MREIDKNTWNDLIFITINNIKRLLKSAKDLLDINNKENVDLLFDHPFVSAGLFTYAVEEYGKLLYLKSLKPINDKILLDYIDKFRNHTAKFDLALEHLPEECTVIGKPHFDPQYFDPTIFDTKQSIATFVARLNIFYSDLTEEGKTRVLPNVDAKTLQTAISKFSEIMDDDVKS